LNKEGNGFFFHPFQPRVNKSPHYSLFKCSQFFSYGENCLQLNGSLPLGKERLTSLFGSLPLGKERLTLLFGSLPLGKERLTLLFQSLPLGKERLTLLFLHQITQFKRLMGVSKH
jgi:hypothetical protein